MTSDVLAPAKVNLTLHVTGRREDGYHLLDSLVVFADLGDRLTLTPGPRLTLEVTGPFAPGVPTDSRNLVWRAAEAAGWIGSITLDKQLPHGGGIGGGSADAGAVLRALQSDADALALGADVPVCHLSRAARMQGVGGQITPLPQVPPMHAVLVNPGVHIPTPAVFRALDRRDNPAMDPLPGGDWTAWLAQQRNDLEPPARRLFPQINAAAQALEACADVQLVRMSGSGSTFFGLFPSAAAAQTAAARVSDQNPGWWCVPTVLR